MVTFTSPPPRQEESLITSSINYLSRALSRLCQSKRSTMGLYSSQWLGKICSLEGYTIPCPLWSENVPSTFLNFFREEAMLIIAERLCQNREFGRDWHFHVEEMNFFADLVRQKINCRNHRLTSHLKSGSTPRLIFKFTLLIVRAYCGRRADPLYICEMINTLRNTVAETPTFRCGFQYF